MAFTFQYISKLVIVFVMDEVISGQMFCSVMQLLFSRYIWYSDSVNSDNYTEGLTLT